MGRVSKFALLLPPLLWLLACSTPESPSGGGEAGGGDVAVAGIILDPGELELEAGSGVDLRVTFVPSNATNRKLTFTSSYQAAARVDASGRVTALKKGMATITAKSSDGGFTSSCVVEVTAGTVPATGVSLSSSEARVDAGGRLTLAASVTPAGATNRAVSWSSSDPSVVSVDANGTVTGHTPGAAATITCTTVDGGHRAECRVSVDDPDPQNLLRQTHIPDAVFLDFCVARLSEWDTNGDGKLYASEAARVERIDVTRQYGSAIESLAGIEHFTGLEWLDCAMNNLLSLDVSSNPRLQYLDCSGNGRMSSLVVADYAALEYLNCSGCALVDLDLGRCNRLVELHCFGNDLTVLDISQCVNLLRLDVSSNLLSSLDVCLNTRLRGLLCGANRLTGLDVSSCPDLELLDCTSNSITSLDLSKSGRLSELICEMNSLVVLDLSGCSVLETVTCSGNMITTIVVGPGNSMLKNVYSSSNRLSSETLNLLFESLPPSGSVISIYDNPGATTCDISIAKNKNWSVISD